VGVYPGFICRRNIFDVNKKRKIRDDLDKYAHKINKYKLYRSGEILIVEKILRLRGGMFEEPVGIPEFFAVEDVNIDFNFIEFFMADLDNEVAWVGMAEEPPETEIQDAHLVRYTFTDGGNEHIREEGERLLRSDQRYEEDIIRDEQIISLNYNVSLIVENLGKLTASAENMAIANIDWDARQPFNLLRNISENITNGWKETLVTAFNDRQLRIDLFKGFSMKMEMSMNRSNSFVRSDNKWRQRKSQNWVDDSGSVA
jgi:hypothetical protein